MFQSSEPYIGKQHLLLQICGGDLRHVSPHDKVWKTEGEKINLKMISNAPVPVTHETKALLLVRGIIASGRLLSHRLWSLQA